MTRALRWRDAVAADRSALQQFLCTPAVRRSRRRQLSRAAPEVERPWELEAQGLIRNLQPPAGDGEMILLGCDDDGIVAVAQTSIGDGPHDVLVGVCGIALRARGTGHAVADEMLDEIIDRHMGVLLASDSDEQYMVVQGNLDPRNAASRAMCERWKAGIFRHDEIAGYDLWLLPVARPDW